MMRRFRRWLARWIQGGDVELPVMLPGDGEAGTALARAMLADLIQERRTERRWRRIKRIGISLMFLGGLSTYVWMYLVASGGPNPFAFKPEPGSLGVVRISGAIAAERPASAAKVIPQLRQAFESDRIRAVVLQIDSPGGAPVESERIVSYLAEMRAKHPKPVYAVIETVGASAAYMIAVGADEIYAQRYSLVGSIGAMLAGWDLHRAMERYGVERRSFASGELKTMLDPFQPATEAATAKAQSMVDSIGTLFVEDVREARGDRLVLDAERLASGEVWNGVEAKAYGLVDAIGTLETLQARFDDAPIKRYDDGGLLGLQGATARWGEAVGAGFAQLLTERSMTLR